MSDTTTTQDTICISSLVTPAGVYRRELARVAAPAKILDDEHGGWMVHLPLTLAAGEQAFAPTFNRKHKDDLAALALLFTSLMHLHPGTVVLALYAEGETFIAGVQIPFGPLVLTQHAVATAAAMKR